MNGLKDIDRDEFKPLYVQIAEQLIAYIKENGLKAGDPLPSQNELIKRYGVSTITVRVAMQRLETDGIIKRIRGKGTFVAEKKIVENVAGIRSFEERLAERGMIVRNHYVESYETLPAERIRNDLKLSKKAKAFKIRRLKMLNDIVLGLETRQFTQKVASRFKPKEFEKEPFITMLGRHPNLKIFRIKYSTRASLASELEAELMKVDTGYPVLVQYGVFYNRENQPVMAGRISYLADKIELGYEIKEGQEFKVLITPSIILLPSDTQARSNLTNCNYI